MCGISTKPDCFNGEGEDGCLQGIPLKTYCDAYRYDNYNTPFNLGACCTNTN